MVALQERVVAAVLKQRLRKESRLEHMAGGLGESMAAMMNMQS